uniref:Uncharacterized protein n=1 Tax=Glossina brevipalpis TaxID=37001 RepID=A0A1A9WIL4_9MUSC
MQLKINDNVKTLSYKTGKKYNNSRHIHLLSCTAVMTSCQELYEIANIHRYTSKATDVVRFGCFVHNHKPEPFEYERDANLQKNLRINMVFYNNHPVYSFVIQNSLFLVLIFSVKC